MIFAWPWMLLALVAVPLVVLWYRRLQREPRRRGARGLAALGLVAARAERAGWRRRLPPVLLLLALVVLVAGLARPEATVPQPAARAR